MTFRKYGKFCKLMHICLCLFSMIRRGYNAIWDKQMNYVHLRYRVCVDKLDGFAILKNIQKYSTQNITTSYTDADAKPSKSERIK